MLTSESHTLAGLDKLRLQVGHIGLAARAYLIATGPLGDGGGLGTARCTLGSPSGSSRGQCSQLAHWHGTLSQAASDTAPLGRRRVALNLTAAAPPGPALSRGYDHGHDSDSDIGYQSARGVHTGTGSEPGSASERPGLPQAGLRQAHRESASGVTTGRDVVASREAVTVPGYLKPQPPAPDSEPTRKARPPGWAESRCPAAAASTIHKWLHLGPGPSGSSLGRAFPTLAQVVEATAAAANSSSCRDSQPTEDALSRWAACLSAVLGGRVLLYVDVSDSLY